MKRITANIVTVIIVILCLLLLLSACRPHAAQPGMNETDETQGSTAAEMTVYNVGSEYFVFAIEVPAGPTVSKVAEDRMGIWAEDGSWYIGFFSCKAGAGSESAKDSIEYTALSNPIEACTIGETTGYVCYQELDGRVYSITYTFDGLTGEPGTWGRIEISAYPSDNKMDVRDLPDDPIIKAILDSVRAPE